MASWQTLCILLLFPPRLIFTSQELEYYHPCVVKNSKSGITVTGNVLEDGVYQFSCEGAWTELLYFRAQINEQKSYVRMSFSVENVSQFDQCQGKIEVTDVSSPQLTGKVDLCRSSPFPETFQSALEVVMRPSSLFVRSKFVVVVEHERLGPEALDAVSKWHHLASAGYPRSYPNFLNVTYTITASHPDSVIELVIEDISLELSAHCDRDYVEVTEKFFSPVRWCRDPVRHYSGGSKVQLRFATDGQRCDRGFRLKFRSRERRKLPGAVVELSPIVNWLFIPFYVVAVHCLAFLCIRMCGHRYRRLPARLFSCFR